jgi:bifunctional non-homologous end joining protein LigD
MLRGVSFFAIAEKMGLEGIMAKKSDSTYTPDLRTKDWLKIKTEKRQELIIGGYTKNEGTPKSLVLCCSVFLETVLFIM